MKVVKSISHHYNELLPIVAKLKEQVDNLINNKKKPTWHFLSRIKKEESFALKIETGRIKDPSQFEDFYACTLVVENLNEIKTATDFVESLFEIKYRKPRTEDFTHKGSDSFPFDDLRLYVSLKPVEYLPPTKLTEIVFEFQIKTFLQHAWAIATHDLIYKSDSVSWPKQRVAYQIKAMLEQAELSISGAEELSRLPALLKDNPKTKGLNKIKKLLISLFPLEALPADIIRLSEIIKDTQESLGITLEELREIINSETAQGRGVKTLDLSPYAIVIQSIINQKPVLIENICKKGKQLKNKVYIPLEISISKLTIEDNTNIICF